MSQPHNNPISNRMVKIELKIKVILTQTTDPQKISDVAITRTLGKLPMSPSLKIFPTLLSKGKQSKLVN